ncbi:7-deoxyloganetin glucosyltransferase-like [Cornus florida]|uniref:7-deoxyloganetin glucosyltransferase-like n=1 Tax=Cornus florida TaxID=4283 RepID=UPI00289C900B|nr:7-deoxyloganetin glucosyltransferase-like [Cornus florida]
MALADKPHAVCIPFPHQSHIKATLKLAKLFHHKGFHITFVNTEFNHRRFLKSRGPNSLDGLPDFQLETIPDGLPASDSDSSQDPPTIAKSIRENCLAPFCDLLVKLNDTASSNVPPVTSIVSDGGMTFTITAAEEFGLPVVLLWPLSACGFMGFYQFRSLVERGLAPLKGNLSLLLPVPKVFFSESGFTALVLRHKYIHSATHYIIIQQIYEKVVYYFIKLLHMRSCLM